MLPATRALATCTAEMSASLTTIAVTFGLAPLVHGSHMDGRCGPGHVTDEPSAVCAVREKHRRRPRQSGNVPLLSNRRQQLVSSRRVLRIVRKVVELRRIGHMIEEELVE